MLERLLKDLDNPNATVRKSAIRNACALPPDQLLELARIEALYSRPNVAWAVATYKRDNKRFPW